MLNWACTYLADSYNKQKHMDVWSLITEETALLMIYHHSPVAHGCWIIVTFQLFTQHVYKPLFHLRS